MIFKVNQAVLICRFAGGAPDINSQGNTYAYVALAYYA